MVPLMLTDTCVSFNGKWSTEVSAPSIKKYGIGDQVIAARIKEREEAKEEFEQAKSEGKSASLLEQQFAG